MPLCDLCGKEAKLTKTEIERARLNVCESCARYGQKVYTEIDFSKPEEKEPSRKAEFSRPSFVTSQSEEQIEEGYALIVKMARERMKLTQADLAKAIAEKENTIHHIETSQHEPTMKVAKKLEQFLRVKLIVKNLQKAVSNLKDVDFSETGLTIGDLLKIKETSKDSSK